MNYPSERNLALFEAVIRGQKLRDAASSAGVTPTRVRQVFYYVLRKLRHRVLDLETAIPQHDTASLKALREHSEFWISQVEKFKRGQP